MDTPTTTCPDAITLDLDIIDVTTAAVVLLPYRSDPLVQDAAGTLADAMGTPAKGGPYSVTLKAEHVAAIVICSESQAQRPSVSRLARKLSEAMTEQIVPHL